MARFEKCDTSTIFLLKDSECYIVRGTITLDDVSKLNKINRQIILIFKNTRGQNSEVIGSINPKNIKISILGGLDYINKIKYNLDGYISKTFYAPKNLGTIIRIFESIERRMNYSWTESQKCMFAYKSLVDTLNFQRGNENDFENGIDVANTLNGLIAGRSSYFGLSLIFKEMMDRLDIECYVQNMSQNHCWNAVRLDREMYLVDMTWDICEKVRGGKCGFNYFCRQDSKTFYANENHDLSNEKEEVVFQTNKMDEEKLTHNYEVISRAKVLQSKVMNHYENPKGEVYDYFYLGEKDGFLTYIIRQGDKIDYFYIEKDGDIKRALDKEILTDAIEKYGHNISRGKVSDRLDKFAKYTRVDGSEFILFQTNSKLNGIREYVLIEPCYDKDNNKILERTLILSENDLVNDDDSDFRYTVANYLLPQERLKTKIEFYNGYVGYVANNSQIYYNREFETEKLGIQQRN